MLLLIGPSEGPITGQSISFIALKKELKKKNTIINTNFEDKNFLYKIFKIFKLKKEISKIKNETHTVYISIKRSFFGILSDYFLIKNLLNCKKKIVIHIHGFDIHFEKRSFVFKKVFKKIWNSSNSIIALSNKINAQIKSLDKKKIYFINNFSEKILSKNEILKKSKKLDQLPIRILFLSNLLYSKGILDVINAVKSLKIDPIKMELIIAGKIFKDKGYSKTKMKNEIYSHLSDQIKYIGPVQGYKKWQLLKQSNILILPTFYDSEYQPISIIEGLSFGCIVITTNQGAITDSFCKENLLLVKKQDPKSINTHLLKILKYPKNYEGLINQSYNMIVDKFNKKKIISEFIKILNK